MAVHPSFSRLAAAPNLAEQVASELRRQLLAGLYGEADRLPTEVSMSRQFGVSRTVVREAVSRLKSEGLVISRQGSGVYARPWGSANALHIDATASRSLEAVSYIVELRRAIEGESAALAAERRGDTDLDAMRDSIRALERAVARGEDGVAEDVKFHRCVAEASRNPYILSVLAFLGQYLAGATRVTRANEARRADFAAAVRMEHAAILDAIEKHDGAKARKAATRHMTNALKRIRQAGTEFWSDEGNALARDIARP